MAPKKKVNFKKIDRVVKRPQGATVDEMAATCSISWVTVYRTYIAQRREENMLTKILMGNQNRYFYGLVKCEGCGKEASELTLFRRQVLCSSCLNPPYEVGLGDWRTKSNFCEE